LNNKNRHSKEEMKNRRFLTEPNLKELFSKYKPFLSLKGTVSRDWGELLMVKIDKTHFFNVAGARLFLNLTTFS